MVPGRKKCMQQIFLFTSMITTKYLSFYCHFLGSSSLHQLRVCLVMRLGNTIVGGATAVVGGCARRGDGGWEETGGTGDAGRYSWEWDNYRPLHQLKLGQQEGRKDEGGGNCRRSPLLRYQH